MTIQKIHTQIASVTWEKRVERFGYLQPKFICIESFRYPFSIGRSSSCKYRNAIWLNDALFLNDRENQQQWKQFSLAFNKNKQWPLRLVRQMDSVGKTARKICRDLQQDWSHAPQKKKMHYFTSYVKISLAIQQAYILAVPLVSFCEHELTIRHIDFSAHVRPYKKLEIQTMTEDLRKLHNMSRKSKAFASALSRHRQRFAWVKTVYNHVEEYSIRDALLQLSSVTPAESKGGAESVGAIHHRHLIVGIQVGIYLRNRIKELMQQVWYSFDGLSRVLANDAGLPIKNFFQLTPDEVTLSIKKQKLAVSLNEIDARNNGFLAGIINGKDILITGKKVLGMKKWFGPVIKKSASITGTSASLGIVKGSVRIILSPADFKKFKTGEVLVTTMTTPNFVMLMKKAAAFVTDEGGLSCHAAIVARELKKPCVIGTKIATQVLKDGDKVEVDANKGIVRKI